MQLSDVEVRILGCLIEKEATTPIPIRCSLQALISVLVLRGPQTLSDIKTRTNRLAELPISQMSMRRSAD